MSKIMYLIMLLFLTSCESNQEYSERVERCISLNRVNIKLDATVKELQTIEYPKNIPYYSRIDNGSVIALLLDFIYRNDKEMQTLECYDNSEIRRIVNNNP